LQRRSESPPRSSLSLTIEQRGSTDHGNDDLDAHDDVDLGDLALLLANYGKPGTCQGDLNCGGDVELTDLAALLAVYGTTCP
jgi:hypothetical protein